MNNEPHAISAILLSRLNESIIQLRTYQTICNDMSNFHDLHELYYDIRNAQTSNKGLCAPSIILERELNAIKEHLISTLRHLRSRQRRRLLDLHSDICKEELKHPRIDTPMKNELKRFVARVMLLIEGIDILLM